MNLSLNNTNNTVLKDGTEKQHIQRICIPSFLMDHLDEIHTAEEIYEMFGKEEPYSAVVQLYVFIFAIFAKNWKVLTPKKS